MLSIGIHIEDRCLTATAVSLKNHKFSLEDNFSIPFSPQSEEKAKYLELVEALKPLQEKYKNQLVRLCFALPQSEVSCFASSFPFSEKFKIMKTLPFEIEENTLFQLDNVFFDGRISSIERNGSSQVISFVALKENVKNFLSPLKQLKIEPYLLSTEGSALASLVEEWIKISRPTAAISSQIYLHLRLKSSQALFFEMGKLKDLFHFNWNYGVILEEMEKKYKLNFKDAHEQFMERAFVLTEKKGFTKEQVFFSDMIQKHLKPLIKELELHKLSVESKKDVQFKEIFLMGPGAVIKNLSAFLSLKLSLTAYRMQPVESLFPFKKENLDNLISLGLALEGLKRPPYTGLNLIHSLKSSKKKLFGTQWLTIGLIFLILTVYSFMRNQETKNLSDKMHGVFMEYGKKIAFIKESRLSKDKIRNFLEEREKNQSNREKIKTLLATAGPMNHLKTLTVQLNELGEKGKLKITSMEIDERKIHIQGFISESFLSQLKSKLTDLSEEDSLKDLSNQKKNEVTSPSKELKNKGGNDSKEIPPTKQLPEKSPSKNPLNETKSPASEINLSLKKPNLEKSNSKENLSTDKMKAIENTDPENQKENEISPEEGVFFSYFLTLKKDL